MLPNPAEPEALGPEYEAYLEVLRPAEGEELADFTARVLARSRARALAFRRLTGADQDGRPVPKSDFDPY
ncbi:MAG: hypothetical protein FJ279_02155 [Planctomycetes bacterium]|nr:hypothetical protein [Planctomycetota bacterium]